MANIRIYMVWRDMLKRCNDPACKAYKNYGGRGITVCASWWDYATFRAWAFKNGYAANLLLDRIDNDGNYEPKNCQFVDRFKSEHNKRRRPDCNIRFHDNKFEVAMRRYGKYYYGGAADTIEEARELKEKLQTKLNHLITNL